MAIWDHSGGIPGWTLRHLSARLATDHLTACIIAGADALHRRSDVPVVVQEPDGTTSTGRLRLWVHHQNAGWLAQLEVAHHEVRWVQAREITPVRT